MNNWNREQLIVALNLYWKVPYNKISGSSNSLIKETASILKRSPAALAYKLMNFTSLDVEKQRNGNKGKSAASKADKEIWDEYFGKWEKLGQDSFSIISNFQKEKNIEDYGFEDDFSFLEGKEKVRLVNLRINQKDFRERILASYNEKCCISGVSIPSLLVASHIIPWSKNKAERLNPRNGICLNSLHDKAFDKGLITISNDFKVKLSKVLLKKRKEDFVKKNFIEFENKTINLPDRFIPSLEFLDYHYENIFQK